MAFPTVETRNNSVTNVVGTAHTVSLPSGIVSGNRLVVAFAVANNPSITFPGGWSLIYEAADASSLSRIAIYERFADGGEGATISVTTGSSQKAAHCSWRISGAHTSTASEGAGSSGYGTTPNPPSLNPAGWDVEDTLWFAILCTDSYNTPSVYPTSYTDTAWNAPTSDKPSLARGERQVSAASEDPGTFTIATSNYRVVTIAIRPAAAVTEVTVDPFGTMGFFGA